MARKQAAEKPATPAEGGSAARRLDTLCEYWAKVKGSVKLGFHEFEEGRAVVEADAETKAAIVREIFALLDPA